MPSLGVGGPVVRLPVLLSQCDEHLVGAVEFVSVLHPHDVGLRQSLNGTAQPHRVPLRHRLIGRMLRERHTCSRDTRGEYERGPVSARCLVNRRNRFNSRIIGKTKTRAHSWTSVVLPVSPPSLSSDCGLTPAPRCDKQF